MTYGRHSGDRMAYRGDVWRPVDGAGPSYDDFSPGLRAAPHVEPPQEAVPPPVLLPGDKDADHLGATA